MSIEHRPDRPDKPWRVRWREEGGNRAKSFRLRKDAVRFESTNARRLEGGQTAASRLTVNDWLERWIGEFGLGWELSTLKQRGTVCDLHLSPFLGEVRLAALTRDRLRTWRSDLVAHDRTNKTVNSAKRVLSAALTDAAEEAKVIPSNPALGLKPLPEGPIERDPIPLEILRAVLERLPGERDRRIVGLMAFAGLRPQEVRALEWDDIGENTIWVSRAIGAAGVKKTKSAQSGRSIPIRDELASILGARGAGLVCPGDRGGVLDHHNWTTRVWRPLCRAMKVDFVPYSCRHTYASLRISEGDDPVRVAQAMGHSTADTTFKHYARQFGEARALADRNGR